MNGLMMADAADPQFTTSARRLKFAFTCSGLSKPELILFSRDTLNS